MAQTDIKTQRPPHPELEMSLNLRKLTDTFAAEVIDLHPREALDSPELQEALKAAFRQHRVLLFRARDLTSEEQSRFAKIFGEHQAIFAPTPEENTQYVSNNRPDGMLANGELSYHQDNLFDETPTRAIMLYGVEVPTSGGATKFRSCHDMYNAMSDDVRVKAETLQLCHLFDYASPLLNAPAFGTEEYKSWRVAINDDRQVIFSLDTAPADAPRCWQPLVWRDPEGGPPALWCTLPGTVDMEGIEYEEGVKLLRAILDQCEGVNEYIHHWSVGDLLIWDNRHTQHARVPFEADQARTLRRSTLL